MTTSTGFALSVGVLIGFAAAALLQTAQAQNPATTIRTESGAIVFVVDGEELGRVDAAGMHVNGSVYFTGSVKDTITYDPASRAAGDVTR